MEPIAELVRSALADGPRRRDDLLALVRPHDPSGGTMVWNGLGAWFELVRVPPSGTWEHRRADLHATAESRLGHSAATEEDGLEHLLRRYLGAFVPPGSPPRPAGQTFRRPRSSPSRNARASDPRVPDLAEIDVASLASAARAAARGMAIRGRCGEGDCTVVDAMAAAAAALTRAADTGIPIDAAFRAAAAAAAEGAAATADLVPGDAVPRAVGASARARGRRSTRRRGVLGGSRLPGCPRQIRSTWSEPPATGETVRPVIQLY
jgi:DAK2 domain